MDTKLLGSRATIRMIKYVPKQNLYPRFGYAIPKKSLVLVRADLPEPVKKFVVQHELYHLEDKSKWWVWREIKANAYGAWKHPWGFIVCCVMSMAPYRIKYYYNRILIGG